MLEKFKISRKLIKGSISNPFSNNHDDNKLAMRSRVNYKIHWKTVYNKITNTNKMQNYYFSISTNLTQLAKKFATCVSKTDIFIALIIQSSKSKPLQIPRWKRKINGQAECYGKCLQLEPLVMREVVLMDPSPSASLVYHRVDQYTARDSKLGSQSSSHTFVTLTPLAPWQKMTSFQIKSLKLQYTCENNGTPISSLQKNCTHFTYNIILSHCICTVSYLLMM